MTRLEQVGRTRHFLALRERLRHGHENTVAPNDFTKTEKVLTLLKLIYEKKNCAWKDGVFL